MSDDGRDGIRIQRRWFRIGLALFGLHAVATLVAVLLLRVDRSLALVAIVVSSVLVGWLIVFYFVYVAD